ncbi:hypothetical protein J3R83DRAFT_1401 [Lanmaoa asiatica]|nr:hypothetical protein J3R83DRAFT_1401 [Lanmaoa asiatica]
MPMRYRSDSPLRPLSPDSIEPTDADDSIVLSDLVRTGEASRLRRRGAMRLDHNLLSVQRNEGGRVTPPTVIVARTPSWIEPPSDDDESMQAWEQGYDPSSRPQGRSVIPGPETYGYTLYCGGEETLSSFEHTHTSLYARSPLPSYPPVPSDSALCRHDDLLRKTNGCGAVVHLRASRRDGSSVWIGKDEATSAVIPMDASYFERHIVVKMIRSACGCVREGVGCAIWQVIHLLLYPVLTPAQRQHTGYPIQTLPNCRGWAIFPSPYLAGAYLPSGAEVLALPGFSPKFEHIAFLHLYLLRFQCYPRVSITSFTGSTSIVLFTRGGFLHC